MEPFPTAPLSGRESTAPVSLSAVVVLRRWEARSPRRLSLQRFHPTAFPFLHRVSLRKNSPASTVLWNATTPHRPSRRTSFSFACRYHSHTDVSLPTAVRGTPWAGGLVAAAPRAAHSDGNDRASHVRGEPAVPMPCSSTPAGSSAPGHPVRRRGPRSNQDEGSRKANYGALSHGLGTRCLRFAG